MLSKSRSIIKFYKFLVKKSENILNYQENIEKYSFNEDLIAYRGKRSFPDMILKSSDLSPGSMIEIKDGRGSTISSFNSTYPSGSKSILDLEKITGKKKRKIRKKLSSIEESPKKDKKRDVYYLIRTYRESKKSEPIISLVHGNYFGESESVTIAECLEEILKEIKSETKDKNKNQEEDYNELLDIIRKEPYIRHYFSQTRKTSSGVKTRFRIMYEVENDLNPNENSKIPENSINFITQSSQCNSFREFKSLFDSSKFVFEKIKHKSNSGNDVYYAAVSNLFNEKYVS